MRGFVLRGLAALLAVGPFVMGSSPSGAACTTTTWSNFTSADASASGVGTPLKLNASAALASGRLRVTPATTNQSGSVFTTSAVSLANDASFSTHFTFQFTDQGWSGGADGVVFVVQTVNNTAGGAGGGIGYAGLAPSIGVEFDNWYNAGVDPNDSHVGYNQAGSMASSPVVGVPDLDDGILRHAWVDYDGATDTLEVRLATSGTRPGAALLTKAGLDLPAVLGSTSAYLGFTSGTGAAWANHDIVSWEYANCYDPIGQSTPPTVSAGADVPGAEGVALALDGTVTDADAAEAVTTAWTYAADPGVDAGATCAFSDAGAVDTTITCTDDGTYSATLSANDGVNSTVVDSAVVTVSNEAPTVHITAPSGAVEVQPGTVVQLTASLADAGANDHPLSCTIDWGDGSPPSVGAVAGPTCASSHTYSTAGVHTLSVTASDDDGGARSDSVLVTVSTPPAPGEHKVTGGGFVVSNGRTSFGFVASSDANGKRGQLQVRTPRRDRFHASEVTAMTVSANTASWSGPGRWNGEDGYTVDVSVVDNRAGGSKPGGASDSVSLTVRNGAGTVVFSASGSLRGGNVTVHR